MAANAQMADARLTARVGDRVRIERVASDLPQTLATAHEQQAVARSAVLVVLLLGGALAVTALLLAGRLTSVVRADEQALLVSLGAGRRRLAGTAAVEALLLAAVAAVLAVPLAAVLHSRLTHRPELAAAGLAQAPQVTGPLLLVVGAAALVMTAALVAPALAARPQRPPTRSRAGAVARSGADLLLPVLAVGGWWQLRSQSATVGSGGDAVQVVAPVLCVAVAGAVALRLLPALLAPAARAAVTGGTLLLPLAVLEAARRPRAVTAWLLLAVGACSGTVALASTATWQRSAREQADVRVGTDLALDLASPPTAAQADAVTAASGGTASAVVARPVALGRFVGDRDAAPVLVAVDGRRAGGLLRGRLDGDRRRQQVGAALAPPQPVVGLAVPDGGGGLRLTVSAGRAAGTATTTLVLQGPSGLRTTAAAAPVAADGRPHALRLDPAVGGGQQLVAVSTVLRSDPAVPRRRPAASTRWP
ncbi:hypothetical protein GCM10025868_01110 [Angustibacter aerolatus]|uniref:ABC3 transporter permease C-terminal domain-containing protein n=1 Tax=Angustibacter aerolatus TaxID=1162965 RepID=A0ABQ6JDK3_9ACTN|nr:FtsX-like permease family protein [Angustibacter aerolatus]GMA84861.1 hypothetical protein GCM10025868_01110 [Angustibacter aerolatus]